MGTSYGQDIDMHYAANKRRGSPTHAPIPASYASAEQQLMLHRYSPGRNGATSTSSDILRTSWFGMCRCSHTLRRVGVLFSTRVRPHNHMVAALDWYSNIARGVYIVVRHEVIIHASVHLPMTSCLLAVKFQPHAKHHCRTASCRNLNVNLLFPAFASRYIALAPMLTERFRLGHQCS
jgi:hypothetical protein